MSLSNRCRQHKAFYVQCMGGSEFGDILRLYEQVLPADGWEDLRQQGRPRAREGIYFLAPLGRCSRALLA